MIIEKSTNNMNDTSTLNVNYIIHMVTEKFGNFNPLIIYGCGDIPNKALDIVISHINDNYKVIFKTAEEFLNEYCCNKKDYEDFRKRLHDINVVAIKDIHLLEISNSAKEQLLYILNEFINHPDKQVIFTTNKYKLNFDDNLIARINWGLVTNVEEIRNTPKIDSKIFDYNWMKEEEYK